VRRRRRPKRDAVALIGQDRRVDDDERSIQERYFPDLTCFGCGPRNERGLRLRSFPHGDVIIAEFVPWPEHDNGLGFLNGGIISTLLDCHSAAAVVREADLRGYQAIGAAALPYVTAGLDVRYLRPAPLHQPVELRAHVVEASEDAMSAEVELVHDGKVRSTAVALWKRWRPRS
jgi:acyl-coenzyme A thioesterase PaaI-like protein